MAHAGRGGQMAVEPLRTINEDLLQEITRRLVELFQPEQVILFGSYVWGTPTADSDVDVMVIVTQSDLSDYERAVLGHRCLSGLNIAKDVIVKTRAEFDFLRDVRASLEYKIARQGKVLYDRRQSPTRAGLAHQSAA
ncbi:nucleotidyltransferase domain-containing protein [Roseiflexus sp.]|jgi:predicted nucleotidyltransferase|uniref:nucleotidyltransferase domain-containing protein n=1 Tax=Roseiflexus sp. TaxID=2562120 RepID=UPI00345875F2